MDKGNPRLGKCLCGGSATIRDTKAEDGRLHFQCHDLTPLGKAKHYGFVDASEAKRLEDDDDYVEGDADDDVDWSDVDDIAEWGGSSTSETAKGESEGPNPRAHPDPS